MPARTKKPKLSARQKAKAQIGKDLASAGEQIRSAVTDSKRIGGVWLGQLTVQLSADNLSDLLGAVVADVLVGRQTKANLAVALRKAAKAAARKIRTADRRRA